jgi:hypothetical protein
MARRGLDPGARSAPNRISNALITLQSQSFVSKFLALLGDFGPMSGPFRPRTACGLEGIGFSRHRGSQLTTIGRNPNSHEAAYSAERRGDYATALKSFNSLAAQNGASAKFALGLMHSKGNGVAQDLDEAQKWFRLAY